MNTFDVRIFAIRRRPGRRAFEARRRVVGQDRSRSFITRALADSYRAELVRAARSGMEFDPATGEPVLWSDPEAAAITWYQHAVAYVDMKMAAPGSAFTGQHRRRAGHHNPLLTRTTKRRPPARTLRAALYGYAFNPQRRFRPPAPATAKAISWLERASLPVSRLNEPRSSGPPWTGCAYGWTVRARQRALSPANVASSLTPWATRVVLGLLPANPADKVQCHLPTAASTVSPQAVANPTQVQAILAQIACARPELAAFFACLYYAALRPEEAVALCRDHLTLPAHGRGKIILTTTRPRTGNALAATPLARRPYDLRHAAVSLWLNASGTPAEIAARAGNSVHVLDSVYIHCISGQEDTISQRIEDALNLGSGTPDAPKPTTASRAPNQRRHR